VGFGYEHVCFPHLDFSSICRAIGTIDELAGSWRHTAGEGLSAEERAKAALALYRDEVAAAGKARIVSAREPGFEGMYAEELRNERVAVAAVSPEDTWDWHGRFAP
jgi:hypothetical protein